MQFYRDLLTKMPTAESVLADAYAAYPGRPELANLSARVALEGLYLGARYALEALVECVEHEHRLRADPPEEPDVPDTRDADGEPVGLTVAAVRAMHVPPLDDECADIGKTAIPASDVTRCDLRGRM